jgi:hypothetical protein
MGKTRSKVVEVKDCLVPAEEARRRLGLSVRQERRQVAEGRLKPVKIGRRNFYRESYIDDIVENGVPE